MQMIAKLLPMALTLIYWSVAAVAIYYATPLRADRKSTWLLREPTAYPLDHAVPGGRWSMNLSP